MNDRKTEKDCLFLLRKIQRSIETFIPEGAERELFGLKHIKETIDALESRQTNDILDEIITQLICAQAKHPNFPKSIIARTSIMAEEAGEAIQAANDIELHGIDRKDGWKKELLQTAAMCIRCLIED